MNNKFCSRFYESKLSPNLKSKIENLKWVGLSVIACVFVVAAGVAEAQQPTRIPRIGFVTSGGNPSSPGLRVEAFQRGLREFGYVEGKNILVEYRYIEGKTERVPVIVSELLQLKVDVLVSTTLATVRAAKQETNTIPIVMVIPDDPVALGLVHSLARPGGNVTGLTRLSRDLSGKRLELLTEVLVGISRVAVLWGPSSTNRPRSAQAPFQDYESPARSLKIALQILEVRPPSPDLAGAFRDAVKGRAQALIAATTSVLVPNDKKIAELAIKHRLPTMLEASHYVEAGGLMSYSANDVESFKRAAIYVDKILKGAKPAELPVEQPTKFEFVINLKTAKQIGLTIPPNVLARADRVIR
jgi:putative tryptophan/tyrosine transport system substrate-binding protein